MPNKRISIDQRSNYLDIQCKHYKEAKRKEKSELPTRMVRVTGLVSRKCGRRYRAKVEDAIQLIANASEYPSTERLHGQPLEVGRFWSASHRVFPRLNTLRWAWCNSASQALQVRISAPCRWCIWGHYYSLDLGLGIAYNMEDA